jgi:hypothetical protein
MDKKAAFANARRRGRSTEAMPPSGDAGLFRLLLRMAMHLMNAAMKSLRLLLLPLLVALTLTVWIPRCISAGQPPATLSDKAKSDDGKKDSTKPPFKGMTKAQALHFYGAPDSVGHQEGRNFGPMFLTGQKTMESRPSHLISKTNCVIVC